MQVVAIASTIRRFTAIIASNIDCFGCFDNFANLHSCCVAVLPRLRVQYFEQKNWRSCWARKKAEYTRTHMPIQLVLPHVTIISYQRERERERDGTALKVIRQLSTLPLSISAPSFSLSFYCNLLARVRCNTRLFRSNAMTTMTTTPQTNTRVENDYELVVVVVGETRNDLLICLPQYE